MNGTSISPLPPTQEEDLFHQLRLLRSRRVGPVTYWRLLAEHKSARAALAALPDVARQAGVTDYKICPEGVVHAELAAGRAAGATLITEPHLLYPAQLRDLGDAPPILWALGNAQLLRRPIVALVGARNASSLGTRMAQRLAVDLSDAGFVVISGLARGVDAAAHNAALNGGTIAVQAGGVDVIYPVENANLAHDIAQKGLRISEMPMGLQPQARHFPSRNRIISGMARAVVVVEAAAKSGSLITARNALDQGREVLAVPGHPFDARASGCNMLIRDGAHLIRSAQDVIDVIGPAKELQPELPLAPAEKPALRETAALHQKILDRLGASPIAEDQLIRDLSQDARGIAPVLVDLELRGQIIRQAGGLLAKAV